MTPEERAQAAWQKFLLEWACEPKEEAYLAMIAGAIRAAVEAERDRCAKIADRASEQIGDTDADALIRVVAHNMAIDIRTGRTR